MPVTAVPRIFGNGLAFTAGIFGWFLGIAFLLIGLKSAGREINWALPIHQSNVRHRDERGRAGLRAQSFRRFRNYSAGCGHELDSRMERAREGYAGSFFQGVFATVLATPCTAPYLGTALGFAFTQSGPIILLMFIGNRTRNERALLLLTAQPAWLRSCRGPVPGWCG